MGEPPERNDLVLLAALTHTVIQLAEKIDGEVADEATIAELRDLHERAEAMLERLSVERD